MSADQLPADTRAAIDAVLRVGNGVCKYAVEIEPEQLAAAEAYAKGRRNRASLRFFYPDGEPAP